jgi:hypothetical protein
MNALKVMTYAHNCRFLGTNAHPTALLATSVLAQTTAADVYTLIITQGGYS